MITIHGNINLPKTVVEYCHTIKLANYKTNSPFEFRKDVFQNCDSEHMMQELSNLVDVPTSDLDYVFFSVCKGAEPHVDQLDPAKFEDTTYVIPVILPHGKSVIHAENAHAQCETGVVYQFDHTKIHSMTVEDTESGCVVIMVGVKK